MTLRLCVSCRNKHVKTGRSRYCEDCERIRNQQPHRKAHRSKQHGALRRYVFRRDHFTCQACGSKEDLTLDYIVPLQDGGTMTPDNARCLCRPCNAGRRDYGGLGEREGLATNLPSRSPSSADEGILIA
jgi:5-methylcytosine-specific restriction endonuclease McrA